MAAPSSTHNGSHAGSHNLLSFLAGVGVAMLATVAFLHQNVMMALSSQQSSYMQQQPQNNLVILATATQPLATATTMSTTATTETTATAATTAAPPPWSNTNTNHNNVIHIPARASAVRETTAAATSFQESETTSPLKEANEESKFNRSNSLNTNNVNNCWKLNSPEWLAGPRFGNTDEAGTDDLLMSLNGNTGETDLLTRLANLLLMETTTTNTASSGSENPDSLLDQSMCHPQGRWRHIQHPSNLDVDHNDDSYNTRLWAVRLAYLAIYYHQHRLAEPEAMLRAGRDVVCQEEAQAKNIGPMDFECRNNENNKPAQYLALTMAGNGLGSNVRGGAVVGLLHAVALDRIAIFPNHGPGDLRRQIPDWPLVSCTDRMDYQCFFRPVSPCVPKISDFYDMYQLNRKEMRRLNNKGLPPNEHADTTILKFQSPFTPLVKLAPPVNKRLHDYAVQIVSRVPATHPLRPAMEAGAKALLKDDPPRPGYNYAAANEKIQHAAAIYFLRPLPVYQREMQTILKELTPPEFDPERALGMPVRGSDKCAGESDCLTLDEHLQVVTELWRHGIQHEDDNASHELEIVFTTEAKSVVAEQQAMVSESGAALQKYAPYQFTWITNDRDVTPDTGFIKEAVSARGKKKADATANDIMLSALTSFQLQLLPRVSIGNCCSNFHIMLNDFLANGCGAAHTNQFKCLQEGTNPALRVCCGWHRDCKAAKKAYFEELARNATRLGAALPKEG